MSLAAPIVARCLQQMFGALIEVAATAVMLWIINLVVL